MRLKLLLDEHLAPQVAGALARRFAGLDVVSIYRTPLQGLEDPPLLEVLDRDKRTLATRDVNSVPLHIRRRLEAKLTHAGVIYIPSKRLLQTDIRGTIRRLVAVIEAHGNEDWTCRELWA